MAVVFASFTEFYYDENIVQPRLEIDGLLFIAFLGSVLTNKVVRFVGWVGICWFILFAVIGSMPNVDHPAFDANGQQRPELWLWKFALALALSASLPVYYRKLRILPSETRTDSTDSPEN